MLTPFVATFRPQICTYWSVYETLKTRFIPGYNAYKPYDTGSTPDTAEAPRSSSSSTTPTSSQTLDLSTTSRYTLCSITACILSVSLTSPIDVIQANWQTSGKSSTTLGGVVTELWRVGGWKSFTRGLGVRVCYAIPSNAISMTTYEALKRWRGIS